MGKWYLRHSEAKGIGIDLTDMTTGVGLFAWDRDEYFTMRLTPDEADKLADELRRVGQFVRDDNDLSDGGPNDPRREP